MKITHEELYKIINEAGTQVDLDKLSPDVDLESIGADSLDMMNILLNVQEVSGVEVAEDDIEKMSTVAQICDYINSRA